jgi:hypothetical protein
MYEKQQPAVVSFRKAMVFSRVVLGSVNIHRLKCLDSRYKMNQTSGSKESNNSASDEAQQAASEPDASPKFGRLLAVLLFAVMLIVVITFATEAYYTN